LSLLVAMLMLLEVAAEARETSRLRAGNL